MPVNLNDLVKRAADPTEYHRIPGLYRRWELEQIIEPNFEYYVEEHGRDEAGVDLYSIYKRVPKDIAPPR